MKKKLVYLAIAIALIISACKKNAEESAPIVPPVTVISPKVDSLVSGASYVTDIYYSLTNGVVKTQPRADWDLAFAITSKSISIHINAGSLDSLFLWKGGTIADFDKAAEKDSKANLATNFDKTSWFNYSAFEQNIVASSPYDQGWGVYNMSTHDILGDSVYILKLASGALKKLALVSRLSSTSNYIFKIADLAANATVETVTIPTATYSTKNFVYYSVVNKQIIDREPAKTTWDFVFTKYDSRVTGNPVVTGILVNEGVETVKLAAADTVKLYNAVTFSKNITGIGFDWKHFNGASYDIVNPYYYIHTIDGKYYRIRFKKFTSKTGTTVFDKLELKLPAL